MAHMTDQALITRRLELCTLFDGVPQHTLSAVAADARRRRFLRGQVIFHEGDPAETLHVIDAGRVKITLVSPDGNEAILAILEVGDFFGELALLDSGPRSATAEAMEATETLEVSRSGFGALLDDTAVRKRVLERVAAAIRRVDRQVERLRFLDLTGRVALHLIDLAHGEGGAIQDAAVAHIGPAILDLPYRQADLAAMVGASRQAVSRTLRELEREGLLQAEGRRIVIPDLRRLERRAGG